MLIDPMVKRMGQRGRGAIVNVIGAGGKVASPIHLPGGSANAALMLVTAGLASAANAVLFLASPCASYVTGVVLTMDGAATPIVV